MNKPTTTKDKTPKPSLPENYGSAEWYEEVEDRHFNRAMDKVMAERRKRRNSAAVSEKPQQKATDETQELL